MKRKVGLICMGSRENRPNWTDFISLLEPELDVEMLGVLDDLTEAEVEGAVLLRTRRKLYRHGDALGLYGPYQ